MSKISRIHKMAVERERAYLKYIDQKQSDIFDWILLMNKAFFLLSEAVEPYLNIQDEPNLRLALHILICRGFKTHKAIQTLLGSGLDQDALALLRNMIETVITARYLTASDSKSKAARFIEYSMCERKRNLEKQRRLDPGWMPPGGQVEIDAIESGCVNFKQTYSPKNTKSWSGLSVQAMAEAVSGEMARDYVNAYSSYCLLTHPSHLAAKEYAPDVSLNSGPCWAPTFRHAASAALLSTRYLVMLIETFKTSHSITSKEVENIVNEVNCNLLARMVRAGWVVEKPLVQIPVGEWWSFDQILASKAIK